MEIQNMCKNRIRKVSDHCAALTHLCFKCQCCSSVSVYTGTHVSTTCVYRHTCLHCTMCFYDFKRSRYKCRPFQTGVPFMAQQVRSLGGNLDGKGLILVHCIPEIFISVEIPRLIAQYVICKQCRRYKTKCSVLVKKACLLWQLPSVFAVTTLHQHSIGSHSNDSIMLENSS